MNPEEMQQSNMTPDESAAALAFATKLSEGMMPQAPQESTQEPDLPLGEEMAEEQESIPKEEPIIEEKPVEAWAEEEQIEPEEDETSKKVDELSKSFDEFKGEVKGMIESKLGDLTKTLKDALK